MNAASSRTILALGMLATWLPIVAGEGLAEIPYMRIEPGVHTSGITRLSTDRENRYLVSSSKDKTARIWALPSGTLVRTLRPPIGLGLEGYLYAVAMSPDSSAVATAGIDRHIYVFDRESGRLLRVLSEPTAVLHLDYSPDGRYLIAALAGKKGFEVYETSGYSRVAGGKDAEGSTHYAAMDSDQHIVTVSDDGFVRLYQLARQPDRSLRLLARRHFDAGYPRSAVFSPDGQRIAVGFARTSRVEILAASTLTTLHQPGVEGCGNNGASSGLVALAWAVDGSMLYGGGACQKSRGRTVIRAWTLEGNDYEDYRVSQDSIDHLLSLKNGAVAFASNDPLVGILAPDGSLAILSQSVVPDYRGMGDRFLVNESGSVLELALERGRETVRFALGTRKLAPVFVFDFDPVALSPPLRTTKASILDLFGKTDDLVISDWENHSSPKLNGQSLSLDPNEISRSLAIGPSEDRFVLGTESTLRCYDRVGRNVWLTRVPGAVWNVNIPQDGRMVVAALGDGTVRWYRLKDGVEIAALLLHRNKTSWIIWSPKGFFDADQEAEGLVGWHLNQGRDHEALFFPVSRFFDRLYRPDVIDALLEGAVSDRELPVQDKRGEPTSILESKRMPPSITIRDHPSHTNEDQIQIEVDAVDEGGGIDEIRIYVNGKVVDGKARGIQILGTSGNKTYKRKRISIDLLPGDNRLRAVAYSLDRVEGTAAEAMIRHEGASKESVLHLVAIGINEYQNPDLNLDFAKLDAEGIISYFMNASSTLFKSVQYHRVFDHEATKEGIRRTLRSIQVHPADEVILFLAGHGETDGASWYFVPYELTYPEKEQELREKGLSSRELQEEIVRMEASKILVLLDSCKSGAALSAFSSRGVEDRKALAQLVRASGAHVVAASTKEQQASELAAIGHGVFTYTLLQGISGGADGSPRDGVVTVRELLSFIESQLPTVSQKYKAKAQYPVAYSMGNDFPIAIVP